jgi:hypothetical protein
MPTKKQARKTPSKNSLSQEQRARRTQSILFSVVAGIMILSMIAALLAR